MDPLLSTMKTKRFFLTNAGGSSYGYGFSSKTTVNG